MIGSKEIKEFCNNMLEKYWQWENTQYETINTVSKQRIWIANGMIFLKINDHTIGLFDKRYLHKSLKKLYAVQIKDELNKYEDRTCH